MKAIAFRRNLVIALTILLVGAFGLPSNGLATLDGGNILVYVTEDGTGHIYDKTFFDDDLPTILGDHGYSVTVTDRETTPEITDALLADYDELWILSTNPYSDGCFSTAEITSILNFRDAGNGLLIMADHEWPGQNYQVDANQISVPLGVTFYGETDHGPSGSPIAPDFEAHPLFVGVQTIAGTTNEGNMDVNNPAEVIAIYQGDNLIAAREDGNGRVVFDVSFARLWDAGYGGHDWILVGDTPQYVRNIADWLMGNQPPTAFIDDISPNPAELGEEVTFVGHGEDPGGFIVAYEWTSSIDGWLSDQASFSRSDLSAGAHIIYFKVQDDDNEWSEEVSEILEIDPGSEDWNVSWSYPPSGEAYQLVMHDTYACLLSVTNNTAEPRVFNYGLSLSYTPLNSFGNEATPDWELAENSVCFLNGESYVFGQSMAEAIGPGSTREYLFSISHDWNWIKPWSLDRIASIYLSLCTAGVYGSLQYVFQTIQFLQMISPWCSSVPHIEYNYLGLEDAFEGSSGTVNVWVRPKKQDCLYNSIQLAGGASIATMSACLVAAIPPFGWVVAIGLFAAEAALYVTSEYTYVQAVDPDSNFTEIASPQPWHEPALDTIPPGTAKTTAEIAYDLMSISEACGISYARYLGALKAGSVEWATVQLTATKYYTQRQVSLTQELSSLTQVLVDSIPIPTPEQISEIRDSLAQYGLPQVEVEIMHRLGFTDDEIEALTQVYVSADDSFYTSHPHLPQRLQDLSLALQISADSLPQPPGGAKIADLGTDPDTLEINDLPPILNCWVEFPGDSDLTDYQIISAILNDTVAASYISPTPGDYDLDGIDDIAMEFDPAMLIPILQQGHQLLSVLGDVILPSADTVLYSGSALVTVTTFIRGDANGDGVIDIADVVYLINYLFVAGSPPPAPLAAGDVNCDGLVDAADVVYLINYLFVLGSPPPSC